MIFVFFDYLKRNKKKRLFPLAVVTPLSGCLVFCFFIIIIIGLLLLLFRKNALIAYCFFVFFFLVVVGQGNLFFVWCERYFS
jgi:hypothetical protein